MLIWIIRGFQQRDSQDYQKLNNDTFYRPPVLSDQCNIGTENYPDSALSLNYEYDDYSQGYSRISEAFRALTKDDILRSHISDNDFRSSNDDDDFGYNLYVFDKRIRKPRSCSTNKSRVWIF